MASNLTSLPAPGITETERAETATFIRETATRIYSATIALGSPLQPPANCAENSISYAEELARALENKGYL